MPYGVDGFHDGFTFLLLVGVLEYEGFESVATMLKVAESVVAGSCGGKEADATALCVLVAPTHDSIIVILNEGEPALDGFVGSVGPFLKHAGTCLSYKNKV